MQTSQQTGAYCPVRIGQVGDKSRGTLFPVSRCGTTPESLTDPDPDEGRGGLAVNSPAPAPFGNNNSLADSTCFLRRQAVRAVPPGPGRRGGWRSIGIGGRSSILVSLQSCEWRVGLGILPFFNRIDDYELHDGRRFGVRDSRGHVQVLQAVLLGILPLEQPGGRGPRRRPRDFDDLLKRHFLVVPARAPCLCPEAKVRVQGEYVDTASGAARQRPELDRLMGVIKREGQGRCRSRVGL